MAVGLWSSITILDDLGYLEWKLSKIFYGRSTFRSKDDGPSDVRQLRREIVSWVCKQGRPYKPAFRQETITLSPQTRRCVTLGLWENVYCWGEWDTSHRCYRCNDWGAQVFSQTLLQSKLDLLKCKEFQNCFTCLFELLLNDWLWFDPFDAQSLKFCKDLNRHPKATGFHQ